MNLNKYSQAKSEFSHVVQMVRNHIVENILLANSFYQSAILMKGWERQWTIFKSNAKYGDMLHPHASKQQVHLPNYILSHTNRCSQASSKATIEGKTLGSKEVS